VVKATVAGVVLVSIDSPTVNPEAVVEALAS
jgi:hypothetical protein